MMNDFSEFLAFAHQLADRAGDLTLGYFRQPLDVCAKADESPVTLADQQTEQALRADISARYPDHAITGEEQSAKTGNSGYEWIIDPIDGTRNFISGYPLYSTLICLLKDKQPVVSLIDVPAMGERFFATANQPTRYRKGTTARDIATGTCQQLSKALLFSTDYGMFTADEHRQAAALREAVSMVRYNGDAYLYALLALGCIDIVLESDLKVYDFMPLKLIVEQAGGVISDWQGQALTKDSCGQVLATSNAALHRQALEKLQSTGNELSTNY